MHMDLPTLMVAGSFVSAISGLFLVFAAMQTKDSDGDAVVGRRQSDAGRRDPADRDRANLAPGLAVMLAVTLLNMSPALIWASARACNGFRVDLGVVGSGAAIWLAAYTIPAVRETAEVYVTLNLVIASPPSSSPPPSNSGAAATTG